MATTSYHGGHCCGISHIHTFDGGETRERLEQLFNVVSPDRGNPNRLAEIVLTDRQLFTVRGEPLPLLAVVRDAGFRLVSRFRNSNGGNICNVFHKVRVFEAEVPEALQWDGVPVPAQRLAGVVEPFAVGTRVLYVGPGVSHFRYGIVQSSSAENTTVDFDSGTGYAYATSSFAPVIARPAAVEEGPRVVLSTWHNNLRGGRGAGFDSFAAARRSAPRAASVSRRDVYADGNVVWQENVDA